MAPEKHFSEFFGVFICTFSIVPQSSAERIDDEKRHIEEKYYQHRAQIHYYEAGAHV